MAEQRAPTILDIAAAAGISKSTASRVLTGSPGVSEGARLAVGIAVEKLGYRVNTAARSLRTTRSALVGMIVPAVNHEVFAEIAVQLDRTLRDLGVTLAITSSDWSEDVEAKALNALQSRAVDVLVVASTNDRSRDLGDRLKALSCPLILLDRDFRGLSCDAVLTDHRTGTGAALQHLWGIGHSKVALLHVPVAIRPGREESAAFRADHLARGLEPILIEIDAGTTGAAAAACDAALAAGATALIVGGAMTAVAGVLRRLDERGLEVPSDISVIAYDESDLASVKRPRLTTISRDIAEIGRSTGQLVRSRLANPEGPPRIVSISTSLIIRESTASPPNIGPPL